MGSSFKNKTKLEGTARWPRCSV